MEKVRTVTGSYSDQTEIRSVYWIYTCCSDIVKLIQGKGQNRRLNGLIGAEYTGRMGNPGQRNIPIQGNASIQRNIPIKTHKERKITNGYDQR